MSEALKPFWRYFGGKYRAAPKYPAPVHDTIIEPFAGAAGYSLRYPERKVILVEKYAVVAEVWRYLINVKSSEIMRIPLVEHVDDLPSWVPDGGRFLFGFCLNDAKVEPSKQLSSGRKQLRLMGRKFEGWSEQRRARTAAHVEKIRHWKIIEGDYTEAPGIKATWYVDPPYQTTGIHYKLSSSGIDFSSLGEWCRGLNGQVMVCETSGASWLPFEPLASIKSNGMYGRDGKSHEVIWRNG